MSLRPRIITSQRATTSFIAPVGERNAVMIGTATWGPVDVLTSISNLGQFISTFGDDKSGTGVTGIKGADLFFRNGGTLRFLRIGDGNLAKATLPFSSGVTDVISITGKYNGTKGNEILVTITENGSNRDVRISDGTLVERYTNGGEGFSSNEDIVNAINNSSLLVTAAVLGGNETTNLVDAVTDTQLLGGNDGESGLVDLDYTTAWDNLIATEDFNFLLIPGKHDDAFHSLMLGRVEIKADSEKKRSRYITGVDLDETISTINGRTTSGKRMTLVAPNVKYTHRIDNVNTVLDGSYLACAYAGKLCRTPLQISGTHETVSVNGLSVNSMTGKEYYSKIEQEQLLETSVLPVSNINNTNSVIRAVTTIGNSSDINFEEVVVDIIDEVVNQVENYLNTVIGQPNTSDRRGIYQERVNAILQVLLNQGIIQEYLDSEVTEGASPDTINAAVTIKPTYNTNFVNLNVTIN